MQEYKVLLKLQSGEEKEITVSETATFLELAEKYEDPDRPVALARFNGHLQELHRTIATDGTLSYVSMTHKDGRRTYRRSVTFLMQNAVEKIWDNKVQVRVLHSLGQGYYCEFMEPDMSYMETAPDMLLSLKIKMMELVDENLPITKKNVRTTDAEELFHRIGMEDKARLLRYRRSSRVNLYELNGTVDYFYGYMLPCTGMLQYFDIVPYGEGFVILFPYKNPTVVEPLETSEKLYQTLEESRDWSRMLEVGTIGYLNDAISQGRGQEIMLLQEALMEQKIGDLAARISQNPKNKFIMIAGPSSSGKTTFSNRLSIQLMAKGLIPHPIGLDDYYVDRDKCPKDEDGKFDFECLESIDVELFNKDMTALLAGEEVEIPSFNFKTGRREYRGRKLKLGEDDVLVIEGIHGLNDKLSYSLPADSKFRIYISALTQLNIDEHNPLSTTDGRLLRRIVRDARTRGTTAQETIAMWDSVRRGEEKYIFPFQDGADAFFNSALIYEVAALKIYAEPLLFQIPKDCEQYDEAKRLLKFLDYFLPLPSEGINNNSLLREFIGGGCFNL